MSNRRWLWAGVGCATVVLVMVACAIVGGLAVTMSGGQGLTAAVTVLGVFKAVRLKNRNGRWSLEM